MPYDFVFTVNVTVNHEAGKFMPRLEMVEKIQMYLDDAN